MNQHISASVQVPIGDLIQPVSSWSPAADKREGTFRYIDLSSINNERKELRSVQSIRFADAPSRARQLVRGGDILVSTVRPNLNGIASLPDGEAATASTGFCVLRPDPSRIDARYLFQWLRTPGFVSDMEKKATGASYPAVSDRIIKESTVPLPPLDEQRRIAAILDQADDLRRKRRAALERLGELRRAAFLDLFGNPLQATPGWPMATLGTVGSLDRGVSKHRPRNDPQLLGGPYPLIQTGDVTNSDGLVQRYMSTYSEIGLKQSRLWPSGTLCITIAANIGRTGILSFDACFPDSVVGFLPGAACTVEYVQEWFGFIQAKLEADAPQFAQKNINLAILQNLTIPVPPLDLQRDFAVRAAEINKLKAAHRANLQKLEFLFASLQERAFRGAL